MNQPLITATARIVQFLLHDMWFDLESVQYNRSTRRLSIPFHYRRPSARIMAVMSISSVSEVSIVDESNIGRYSVSIVEINPVAVSIIANQKLAVHVSIEPDAVLNIALEDIQFKRGPL